MKNWETKLTSPCTSSKIASHSLETGDLATDLAILDGILTTISDYIGY